MGSSGSNPLTYLATCPICETAQQVEKYLDWTCEKCGQRYTYDEGHRIELSQAQVTALWCQAQRRVIDA